MLTLEIPNFRRSTLIPLKLAKKFILSLIFILIFEFTLFPAPIIASEIKIPAESTLIKEVVNAFFPNKTQLTFTKKLPNNNKIKSTNLGYHTMTAYNSEVAQCDSTPCITANGFDVCKHGIEDTIAANFLKFGTKIRIPELFGDRVFIVRDRMNRRYTDRIDIWMLKKTDAKKFGVRVAKIEILE